jgi:pyruvate/2-oxoacid:ferredoxin oxidoreductase alpha subunit
MAISTTQSIWRSGGGDQTRTAYCGSGLMAAQFYISGASAAGTSAKISSATGAPTITTTATVEGDQSSSLALDAANAATDAANNAYDEAQNATQAASDALAAVTALAAQVKSLTAMVLRIGIAVAKLKK